MIDHRILVKFTYLEFLTESVSVSVSSDSENKIKDTNQEELRMMSGFQIVKRLLAYYRPSGLIWIALLAIAIVGSGMPIRGIPMTILIISYTGHDNEAIKSDMRTYLPIMVGIALVITFAETINKFWIYFLSSRMAKTLRKDVYESIVYQPLEFFSTKAHSTGNLTGILAQEIRSINASTINMYFLLIQGFVGMITGLTISLIYSWKIGLVACIFLPTILLCLYYHRRTTLTK